MVVAGIILAGATADGVTVDGGMLAGATTAGNAGLSEVSPGQLWHPQVLLPNASLRDRSPLSRTFGREPTARRSPQRHSDVTPVQWASKASCRSGSARTLVEDVGLELQRAVI